MTVGVLGGRMNAAPSWESFLLYLIHCILYHFIKRPAHELNRLIYVKTLKWRLVTERLSDVLLETTR